MGYLGQDPVVFVIVGAMAVMNILFYFSQKYLQSVKDEVIGLRHSNMYIWYTLDLCLH